MARGSTVIRHHECAADAAAVRLIQASAGSDTDLIFVGKTFVGLIGRRSYNGHLPKITLDRTLTEQMLERIKKVINKRDGTNRDVEVINPPPPLDHPAIQRYLLRRYG